MLHIFNLRTAKLLVLAATIAGSASPAAFSQPVPGPATKVPATQPSPVFAPVPFLSSQLKPEERVSDPGPKHETSAETKTKRATLAISSGTYDVGVIPGSSSCAPGSELITIHMDDEDNQNANSHSGWIGAIVSTNNTTFVFCRVDGTLFTPSVAPYAVLQLSSQCPPQSFSFSRYFDNEDTNNQNSASGNVWPNWSTQWPDTATYLSFCLFPPAFQFPGTFPDLGIEYGVFASNLPGLGLANGHLHTDDEDNGNGNSYDAGYSQLGTWASQIISGANNTDISLVKVRNAPPPPPRCLPKVITWNGSQLTATDDGAHCLIKPVVAGATPFIWNNGYYVIADKSTTCLVGSWDTDNCYFMPIPAGGFLYNDAFYVPAGPGNSCPAGATLDGPNCLIKAAPWGTHAFEWQNIWYFTPQYTCKDGGYDSANCYIMQAPVGRPPFIYNNAFYYQ